MWERVFAAALIGAVTAVGVAGIRLLRRLLRGVTDPQSGS
jgi:hypothetical protein